MKNQWIMFINDWVNKAFQLVNDRTFARHERRSRNRSILIKLIESTEAKHGVFRRKQQLEPSLLQEFICSCVQDRFQSFWANASNICNQLLYLFNWPNGCEINLTSLSVRKQVYADPLPQALVLTAIVISFGMTAIILVMAVRSFFESGSDDVDLLGPEELIASDRK